MFPKRLLTVSCTPSVAAYFHITARNQESKLNIIFPKGKTEMASRSSIAYCGGIFNCISKLVKPTFTSVTHSLLKPLCPVRNTRHTGSRRQALKADTHPFPFNPQTNEIESNAKIPEGIWRLVTYEINEEGVKHLLRF